MNWLKKLLGTLGDLVTSKKAIAAVGTVVSQVIMADVAARRGVLIAGVAYLVGQGAADFGKNAKGGTTPTP